MSTTARTRTPVSAALREIQAPVRERLHEASEELRRIVVADLPLITEVNSHLLQMQGKMFRPTLALLAAASAGRPDWTRAVRIAAVVELMHLATLVHDDSVDHSVLRRGMPTVNSVFSHQVSVIMGDYLYAKSLATLVDHAELEPLRILADTSTQMTVGEMHQLTAMDALAFTEDDYDRLIWRKTASLLSAACEMGALCGAEEHRQALRRYGERLGMAFQVTDDLLDYTEGAAVTGKPSGLDLREHKVTLPLIHALDGMPAPQRERVDALFAAPEPDDALIADVVALVAERGGIEYARQKGERFAHQAEEALRDVPEGEVRTALTDAIVYVMDRRS